MPCFFIVNEHEPAMPLTKKNNHRSKFRFQPFYLGISADADLQSITFFGFSPDRIFNGFSNGKIDRITIKFSP